MTKPAPPTVSPDDPLVQHVAKALSQHESYGGGRFCSCCPVDTHPMAFEGAQVPLEVYWDTHLAQVATEAALEYLQPIVGP